MNSKIIAIFSMKYESIDILIVKLVNFILYVQKKIQMSLKLIQKNHIK